MPKENQTNQKNDGTVAQLELVSKVAVGEVKETEPEVWQKWMMAEMRKIQGALEPTVVIFPTEAGDFQKVEQHRGCLIQVET